MKAFKLGLMAASVTAALAMPIASNAAVVSVAVNNGPFSDSPGTLSLVDQDSVTILGKGFSAGTHTVDTYFQLAAPGPYEFSATVSFVKPTSSATGVLVGATGGWNSANGQFEYTGLKAGTVYNWQTTFTVAPGTKLGGFNGQLTVAAVPEPEEWAMMLVGAGLVSFQVRRKQKGLSQTAI